MSLHCHPAHSDRVVGCLDCTACVNERESLERQASSLLAQLERAKELQAQAERRAAEFLNRALKAEDKLDDLGREANRASVRAFVAAMPTALP